VRSVHRRVFCGVSALVLLGTASFVSAQCDLDKRPGRRQELVKIMNSPFVFRPLDYTIHAVKGTDGLIHLAYVAQVTNGTAENGTKFRAEPVDPDHGFAPTGHNFVKLDEGQNITGLIRRFAAPVAAGGLDDQLDPDALPIENQLFSRGLLKGESGVMYFDVTYSDPDDVPKRIAHRLTVDLDENGTLHHTAITLPVEVDCTQPVVLHSPLEGAGWFDTNGCCAIVNAHRFFVLHLNGGLFPPQQFAVDWMRLNRKGECCTGDPLKLESWPFFGVPIHAAASGTVVKVLGRDLPDQVPLHPIGMNYDNIAGNGIIEDIGHGRFIMYAHLKKGSLAAGITVGTHIRVGEQIGLLGNSGNSGAPHLHFQVMDAPSELLANGLPFVIDDLTVEGRVTGEEGDVVDAYLHGKPVHLDTSENGPQTERMPISSTVYAFKGAQP
jgi:hypothetical protein